MIQLLHRWIWRDPERCARKLLNFAETEADGGRDLVRAAELTQDPTLRRLYMVHAADEERHAATVPHARRGAVARPPRPLISDHSQLNWVSPGERGLDDLRVHSESDASLLAFLHLSEKSAAGHFAAYVDALQDDPSTSAVFKEVLQDETFHMNYTLAQLTRVAPAAPRLCFCGRRGSSRLWKAYLRADVGDRRRDRDGRSDACSISSCCRLSPFLAKRAERREPQGWTPVPPERERALESQY